LGLATGPGLITGEIVPIPSCNSAIHQMVFIFIFQIILYRSRVWCGQRNEESGVTEKIHFIRNTGRKTGYTK